MILLHKLGLLPLNPPFQLSPKVRTQLLVVVSLRLLDLQGEKRRRGQHLGSGSPRVTI